MKSAANKNLIVKQNVILNDKLDIVICQFDEYFGYHKHTAYVTSGVREPMDQLRIIKNYCTQKNIKDEFIEKANLLSKVIWNEQEIYSWQLAWSKLLNAGVIINPPKTAKLLLDYVNKSGKNRKGDMFAPSIHFAGRAFDIGGASNGVNDELEIVIEAIKAGAVPTVTNFVVERENNCLHINVV